MLRRCITRPPPFKLKFTHIRVSQQRIASRFQSTTTAETATKPATSRKWKLYAVVGLVGFTIGSWYRIINAYSDTQAKFEIFELISKEPVSSTASIFTIKPRKPLLHPDEYAKAWAAGIWNVQFKQPQLQIVRAYTPLPPLDSDSDNSEDEHALRFLIRKDAKGGEMSSYLHRLPVGAAIELRGPHIEYALDEHVKNVVFVAGGTGIAPALQIAHAMFDGLSERQKAQKSLHVIWGNRRREDCAGTGNNGQQPAYEAKSLENGSASSRWALFGHKTKADTDVDADAQILDSARALTDQTDQRNELVKYLDTLTSTSNGRVKVSYFVDEEQSWITSTTLENTIAALPPPQKEGDTQVIVSGPPGFITYIAGPKVWQDGEEKQGVLSGRLAQVLNKDGRRDIKVWKV